MAFSIPIFLILVVGILLLAPKPVHGKRVNVAKAAYKQKRARVVTVKASAFERFKVSIVLALEQGGTHLTWDTYTLLSGAAAVLGAAGGALFDNLPLAVVLAFSLPVGLTQYIRIRALSYRSFLIAQIEDSLGIISSSYMQCLDIRTAIESCLDRIDAPLKSILSDCVHEIYLGAHTVSAIAAMRTKVDNRSWREWCDTVMQCQDDRNLAVLLPPIIEQLAAVRQEQVKLETQTAQIWRDHAVLCIVALGAPPFIRLLNADWYMLLTTTVIGKVAIAFSWSIVFLATLYAARINKPISMEV